MEARGSPGHLGAVRGEPGPQGRPTAGLLRLPPPLPARPCRQHHPPGQCREKEPARNTGSRFLPSKQNRDCPISRGGPRPPAQHGGSVTAPIRGEVSRSSLRWGVPRSEIPLQTEVAGPPQPLAIPNWGRLPKSNTIAPHGPGCHLGTGLWDGARPPNEGCGCPQRVGPVRDRSPAEGLRAGSDGGSEGPSPGGGGGARSEGGQGALSGGKRSKGDPGVSQLPGQTGWARGSLT